MSVWNTIKQFPKWKSLISDFIYMFIVNCQSLNKEEGVLSIIKEIIKDSN